MCSCVQLVDNMVPLATVPSTHLPNGDLKLYKTSTIQLTSLYVAITNDEDNYTCSVDVDIIEYLVSRRHNFPLSGGLCPVYGSNDSAIALYFIMTISSRCIEVSQLYHL